MSEPRFLAACRRHVLFADGGMGTELQRAGLAIGESGESWNLEHPERVAAIHRAYLEAGSDAILTNSFGANRWVLGRYELAGQVEAINREAARIARTAAGPDRFALGDIGPCGMLLQPLGEVSPGDLYAAFLAQARALLEGGVDGIVVETMTAIEEAIIGVRAARDAGAPVVVASMAFDRLPNGSLRTMMGVAPETAARALAAEGAHVVGANCGTKMTIADFARLAGMFRAGASLPILMKPNAGQPEMVDGRVVYRLGPADFGQAMRAVIAAGASVVGGCCGTTPDHIRALRVLSGAVAPS